MVSKSAWLSRTWWFGLLTAIFGLVSLFIPAVQDFMVNNAATLTTVWGVLAMFLRKITKDKIILTE